MAEAMSSAGIDGIVGISITALVWSSPWRVVVAVFTHLRMHYSEQQTNERTFNVTSFSFPRETRRRR